MAIHSHALPPSDDLHRLLRYDKNTGLLFWRERTPDMFAEGGRSPEQSCALWNARYAGAEAFTAICDGYRRGAIFKKHYLAHRIIYGMHSSCPEDAQVDHIDGDTLNNRMDNLRLASHAENGWNRRRPSNNVSGVKGVNWHRGKWQANITSNGVRTYLGVFNCRTAAAIAYAKASIRRHGKFGRIA